MNKNTESVAQHIETLLKAKLQANIVQIQDDSASHHGHAGNAGGGHFSVQVAAPTLLNKSRLEQHRLINQALKELFDQKHIHALQIKVL